MREGRLQIITGAILQREVDNEGIVYMFECNNCGEEFCHGRDREGNKDEVAMDRAITAFDHQRRKFCYICGHRLVEKKKGNKRL